MPHSEELILSDLFASLSFYKHRVLRLRCETAELLAGTRETIAQSRAIIAMADAVLARDRFGSRGL
jgi:hypothetical protein